MHVFKLLCFFVKLDHLYLDLHTFPFYKHDSVTLKYLITPLPLLIKPPSTKTCTGDKYINLYSISIFLAS